MLASKGSPEGWSVVGGVARPATDVALKPIEPKEIEIPLVKHGFQPGLPISANPQVAGVYEALKDRNKPSRFSSYATPEPFDSKAFKDSPEEYVNTVEPSRVFAPAQPGEGVKVIRSPEKLYHRVVQGESVRLRAEVAPGDPVTFTSFHLGTFENSLSSITVQANSSGIAEADFRAGPGTIDDVEILAAGPLTSGQLAFIVNVQLPQN